MEGGPVMTREEAIKAISDMILDMEYPNSVYHEKFTEDESRKHLALYAVKKSPPPRQPGAGGEGVSGV